MAVVAPITLQDSPAAREEGDNADDEDAADDDGDDNFPHRG